MRKSLIKSCLIQRKLSLQKKKFRNRNEKRSAKISNIHSRKLSHLPSYTNDAREKAQRSDCTYYLCHSRIITFPCAFDLKPWLNGVASKRKLKSWVYLRLRLARPCVTCVDLRWLALTLVEIKFARRSKQVFHRLAAQPKSTQVEWRPLTYYKPIKYSILCLKMFFWRLACTCEETSSPFGHPTQVST